jgi:hypothetical protein
MTQNLSQNNCQTLIANINVSGHLELFSIILQTNSLIHLEDNLYALLLQIHTKHLQVGEKP